MGKSATAPSVYIKFGADLRSESLRSLEAAPDALHQVINFFMSNAYPMMDLSPDVVLAQNSNLDAALKKTVMKYHKMTESLKKLESKKQKQVEEKKKKKYKTKNKQTVKEGAELDFAHIAEKQKPKVNTISLCGAFLVEFIRRMGEPKKKPKQQSLEPIREPLIGSGWSELRYRWSEWSVQEKLDALKAQVANEPPVMRYTIGHMLQLLDNIGRSCGSVEKVTPLYLAFLKTMGRSFVGEFTKDPEDPESILPFAIAHLDDVFRDPNTDVCYHRCYTCHYTHVFDRILARNSWYEGTNLPVVYKQLTNFLLAHQVKADELLPVGDEAVLDQVEERISRSYPIDVKRSIVELKLPRLQAVQLATALVRRFLVRLRDSEQLLEAESIDTWFRMRPNYRVLVHFCVGAVLHRSLYFLHRVHGFMTLTPQQVMQQFGSWLVYEGQSTDEDKVLDAERIGQLLRDMSDDDTLFSQFCRPAEKAKNLIYKR